MRPDLATTHPLEILNHDLRAWDELATREQLGNRRTYVGMSDIGRACECMRSAVLQKLHPQRPGDLGRQLTLQRGHWQEHGIAQALLGQGRPMLTQLEIAVNVHGVPIRAHLDITLIQQGKSASVHVWELKSAEHLPETLYPSYELQLYGQLGLLEATWSLPCCSIKDALGRTLMEKVPFPELVHRHLGIHLPEQPTRIEGWVLCVGMSEARSFGPYRPDKTMLQLCLAKGQELWANLASAEQPETELPFHRGFHPLCDWCEVNADCPKFASAETLDPQWSKGMEQLEQLKRQKGQLEKDIQRMEAHLKNTLHRLGHGGTGTWVRSGPYRFRSKTIPGRTTLDTELVRKAFQDLAGSQDMATNLMASMQRTGVPHERLYIQTIHANDATQGDRI